MPAKQKRRMTIRQKRKQQAKRKKEQGYKKSIVRDAGGRKVIFVKDETAA